MNRENYLIMSYEIQIQPANVRFQASNDDTLLNAALNNQISLEHSCKNGECGLCLATLISGTVENKQGQLVSTGDILTCCSYATSNLELHAKFFPELSDIKCQILPCKLATKSLINQDILILTLRLPPKTDFKYLAGQYIDLIYKGIRRSYSIANIQECFEGIELHIRIIPNGIFSQLLLTECSENQLMRIEGPKGTFFIRESTAPIIFIAGGTGFAPIKAMLESLLNNKVNRMIYIYWGMSNAEMFYSPLPELWAREHHQISYIPVVSENIAPWQGRKGLVYQAVLEDFSDLSSYHVYACGAPTMIKNAREALIGHGLVVDNFYADIFVPSK